jgi:hypothetical protein
MGRTPGASIAALGFTPTRPSPAAIFGRLTVRPPGSLGRPCRDAHPAMPETLKPPWRSMAKRCGVPRSKAPVRTCYRSWPTVLG